MTLTVKCYSGYKADERPISFNLDGQDFHIDQIIDSWVGEDHQYWKVETDTNERYLLKIDRELDVWHCEKC